MSVVARSEPSSSNEDGSGVTESDDPRVEPLDKRGKQYIARDHIQLAIHVTLLLATARTFGWFNAWLVGGVVGAIKSTTAVILLRVNPAVLNARGTKREIRGRERGFFAVLVLGMLATPIVAGLEVGAAGWTHRSVVELAIGLSMVAGGGLLGTYALAVNAFFEPTVRLQDDRAQRVCSAGPYRFVRHPGYVSATLVIAGIPLVLGSRWAFIPAAAQIIALIVRTRYEDRMLHDGLEGYSEFAKRTRYRLLPGIW